MYKIINKQKNNKTLYTVVYVTHHLSLPMCQSYDYSKCVDYINRKEMDDFLHGLSVTNGITKL